MSTVRVMTLALFAAVALGPLVDVAAHGETVAGDLEVRVTSVAGEPVAGVRVQAVDIDTTVARDTAFSTDDGSARLVGLPQGTYHIAVHAPEGYLAVPAPLVTVASSPHGPTDVTLVPQDGADWFDYALSDTVASTDGASLITEQCGLHVLTDANTEWLGDLVSVAAIEQALGSGATVCMAYEGVHQEDGNFLATAVFAMTCTDELGRAYEREAQCPGSAGTVGSTSNILAGLLGAGAFALGITQVTSDQPGEEIVTQ